MTTNGDGKRTAEVEVLTAEVRVLMVGSRQVTMSVYNQLDAVEMEEIAPFGRVAPRNAEGGFVYVVGISLRDRDAGTLVRAEAWTAERLTTSAKRSRNRAEAARIYPHLYRKWQMLRAGRTGWISDDDERESVNDLEHQLRELGRVVFPNRYDTTRTFVTDAEFGAAAEIAAWESGNADDYEAGAVMAGVWEALPLIVLAGLR